MATANNLIQLVAEYERLVAARERAMSVYNSAEAQHRVMRDYATGTNINKLPYLILLEKDAQGILEVDMSDSDYAVLKRASL